MALIEQARQNLTDRERTIQEQEETDKQFAELRKDCEQILEEKGTRIKSTGSRIELITYTLLPPFTFFILRQMKSDKMTLFEMADRKTLAASINGQERPIEVTLNSSAAVPSKSRNLSLYVEGLEESLIFDKNFAEIFYGGRSRPAKLNDFEKWKEVVGQIKQHLSPPPSTPS